MAAQSRGVPAAASYHQLPPSHRIALLPVTDSKKVEQLADDAIEKDMTVVKLRERVAKLRSSSQTPRGRPRVPAVVRALTAIQKLLIDQETGRLAFLRANIDELNDDQRADLRLALDRASELLERLNKLVGK